MAGKWVKSMQCKTRAVDDVFIPLPKHQPLILPSASCRNSFQGLKDVVDAVVKPSPSKLRSEPEPEPDKPDFFSISTPPGLFPSLSNLPEGHASRNVVEIIFRTRWAPKSGFPGRVEMVFKLHNSGRTLARFEEYREAVKSKSRAGSEDRRHTTIRCVADGNEMMRFYCLGPTSSGLIDGGDRSSPFGTFSGGGAAHDSAGGGRGRRAMLLCRVIAGRVSKRAGSDPVAKGFESARGENGVLRVFDARALLPCFLVIYKL